MRVEREQLFPGFGDGGLRILVILGVVARGGFFFLGVDADARLILFDGLFFLLLFFFLSVQFSLELHDFFLEFFLLEVDFDDHCPRMTTHLV